MRERKPSFPTDAFYGANSRVDNDIVPSALSIPLLRSASLSCSMTYVYGVYDVRSILVVLSIPSFFCNSSIPPVEAVQAQSLR